MSYSLWKPEGFWARAVLGTSLVLGIFGQLAFGQFSDGKIVGTVIRQQQSCDSGGNCAA